MGIHKLWSYNTRTKTNTFSDPSRTIKASPIMKPLQGGTNHEADTPSYSSTATFCQKMIKYFTTINQIKNSLALPHFKRDKTNAGNISGILLL